MAVDDPARSSLGLDLRLQRVPAEATATVLILLPGHGIEELPAARIRRTASSLAVDVPGRAIVLALLRW